MLFLVLSDYKLPINTAVIFELSIHFNFAAILLPVVVGGLMLSFGNPSDFLAITVSVSPVGIAKVSEYR